MAEITSRVTMLLLLLLLSPSLLSIVGAYRPGDIVPMNRMGQYHNVASPSPSSTLLCSICSVRRTSPERDIIGRHCPVFAVNREVLIPIPKPEGWTQADPYKITFQIGKEKFHLPWLFVINRDGSSVPMIDFHLRYSGGDLLGVTAKIVDMPDKYLAIHPDVRKQFWDRESWPKHVLARYTWEEQSEIDVTSGFHVLFGSGLMLSFVLAIYILQSSKEKIARFVRETVAENSMPMGEIAKVE